MFIFVIEVVQCASRNITSCCVCEYRIVANWFFINLFFFYRRISRSYLRQLWDENYQILATEDAEKELFFRSVRRMLHLVCDVIYLSPFSIHTQFVVSSPIFVSWTFCFCNPQMLRLQKVLQVKTHMRSILESSRLRLLKEFGAENKALEHVRLLLLLIMMFSLFYILCGN